MVIILWNGKVYCKIFENSVVSRIFGPKRR